MNKSEDITKLAIALSVVQSIIQGAKKDSLNPHFKKPYADLTSVWDACREPLTKNGLSVAQLPGKDEYGHYVETMLIHDSGQWIKSRAYVTPVKDDPQAIGSAITYARRYGLSAMVGVCPEDDDAEGAMNRNNNPTARPEPSRKQQAASTESDL